MAQPNVAREPSMDEILASIRKIIESNEPGIPGFPANDIGPAQDDAYRGNSRDDDGDIADIHLTIDDDMLIAEFEAEIQQPIATAEPVVPVQQVSQPRVDEAVKPAVPAAPALSLADVAARVRAASERHSHAERESVVTTPPVSEARLEREQAEDVTVKAENAIAANPEPEAASKSDAVRNERVVEKSVVEDVVAVASQVSEEPARPLENRIAALISPAVSNQVARSFDDLAVALDSSPRRSFDEIAEEMLRPMLHEWLDDNLPTLVERLVREEIERVARGPRR